MIKKNQYNYLFYITLCFLVVVLLFVINTLSISYKEALNVFENTSVLSYITKISIYIFGQNDFALRAPFLIAYILSVILMYKITHNYFKYEKDRFYSIVVFMLLPGVISASLLVNSAIIVIFFTLLYIYYFQRYKKHSYLLLILYLFIDNSFAILFLAIFLYSLKNEEDKKIVYISSILFILSLYIYGFSTDGKPRGYLLDTFAIYSTIFSPLLFLYFVYTLYRSGLKEEKNLSWYISTSALFISLLFSLRQKIYIEDFAPYVIVSLPLMLKSFYHSYRVRLKEFRKNHKLAMNITIAMLFINVLLTIINKPLYLLLPNIEKHIAYKHHFAKDIAKVLKEKQITQIDTKDAKLQLRLKYYGIQKDSIYYLSKNKTNHSVDEIKISYHSRDLIKYYINKK